MRFFTIRSLFHAVLVILIGAALLSCAKEEGEKKVATGPAELNHAAPSFTLSDSDGRKVQLSDFKGKVVMLEFFTTWCGPCQIAAPEIQSIYQRYKDKGFVVLGISLDAGANALSAVSSFKKEYGVAYAVLMDDGAVSRQYGVFSIPTSFIIDKQGTVRNKHMGIVPDLTKVLSQEIETLI